MSEPRLTRAAAREATGSITKHFSGAPDTDAIAEKARQEVTSKAKAKAPVAKKVTKSKKPARKAGKTTAKKKATVAKGKKTPLKAVSKKSKTPAVQRNVTEDLPHNLGSAPVPITKPSPTSSDKENNAHADPISPEGTAADKPAVNKGKDVAQATVKEESPEEAKSKFKDYGFTPGVSPFPRHRRPTPIECEIVKRLLSDVHGEITMPKTIPAPSLTVAGCGEVPSVLDALIRTLLSAATTSNNSSRAFNGLVQRFGILEEGIGKGSVNWEAVRQAPLEEVFEAIKSGGLAATKSKNLKAILDLVHAENQERRKKLLSDAEPSSSSAPNGDGDGDGNTKVTDAEEDENIAETEDDKKYEIACADQNFLSLNHLHHVSTEKAMAKLTKYPGIGPKTAACVLLFCLQRPCFAVDTHIFRLCKWLNWLPEKCRSEVDAFKHLEVRIPNHLKYSLHQLFIRHGRTCPRCRAITGETSAGWAEGCPIDHLVKRTGKRKGGKGKPKQTLKKRKAGSRSSPAAKKRKIVFGERDGEKEVLMDDLSEMADTITENLQDEVLD